ncbi:MAG: fumarylacetoacetate hydrolase family protein [Alphaproteobacteria bacterium]|nr:fumarylacetoacetate hydrolase family protein [Alphaproteobacteria bacterium]MCB9791861.1 fumarylacetoacetate hydrolase family protein [Alphaproteobacteria bacterium]
MGERRVRFQTADGQILVGALDGDGVVARSSHGPLGEPSLQRFSLAELRLLVPCTPSKVVGVASNYRDHAKEMGRALPTVPKIFVKPSTSVIGTLEPIEIPPDTVRVDHEAELGVVIGQTCRRCSPEDALGFVLGYTVVNDVTARDFQKQDGVFGRGKGFDSFCPIGPAIATGLDPRDLAVRAWVDGELRQDGRTSDMVFDVPTLISFISRVMTLLPGDVIATGTPAGVGPLRPGQLVEVEVEGVGVLRNPVLSREDRAPDTPNA